MESNVYSEIYSFIRVLGKHYINKLPQEEYKKIYKNRNKEYNPQFVLSDFNNNKMLFKTKVIIFYYHVKYWCDTDEEKKLIKKIILNKNELKI